MAAPVIRETTKPWANTRVRILNGKKRGESNNEIHFSSLTNRSRLVYFDRVDWIQWSHPRRLNQILPFLCENKIDQQQRKSNSPTDGNNRILFDLFPEFWLRHLNTLIVIGFRIVSSTLGMRHVYLKKKTSWINAFVVDCTTSNNEIWNFHRSNDKKFDSTSYSFAKAHWL